MPKPDSVASRDFLPGVRRVVVACTATLHGTGTRRLPDRIDAEGPIAAFMVENSADAKELFRDIDDQGRKVFVDVERKQEVDLVSLAREVLRYAEIYPVKSNETTIRSLDILLTQLIGVDLSHLNAGVIGTGNLGFKTALSLAERGANVVLHGRDPEKARGAVRTIQAILPRFNTANVSVWDEQHVDLLVTAVAAQGVVGIEWSARLRPTALVIDVGIGNLSEALVGYAISAGVQVVRLDVRASGSQLNVPAPDFFTMSFGQGRLEGLEVASGGIIGPRGTVVVDSFKRPRKIFGIADGVGGLLPTKSLTQTESGALTVARNSVRGYEEGH